MGGARPAKAPGPFVSEMHFASFLQGDPNSALALCYLTDGAVSRGWSRAVPGCTAQRIIIRTTSVQASHRSTVSHLSPQSRCIPASESSRKGTGTLAPQEWDDTFLLPDTWCSQQNMLTSWTPLTPDTAAAETSLGHLTESQ